MNKTVLAIIVGSIVNYLKKNKQWRFRVTDGTVIRVGGKTANLSDLKAGQSVKVEYQRQGNTLAALTIIGLDFRKPILGAVSPSASWPAP
jgi:3-dehydroquinate synthase class II